jgi:3-mercaptopropionate dioxygenase
VVLSAGSLLAVLIGVNIGPELSYPGSLANLVWRRLLANRGYATSAAEFTRLGLLTGPAALALANVALGARLHARGPPDQLQAPKADAPPGQAIHTIPLWIYEILGIRSPTCGNSKLTRSGFDPRGGNVTFAGPPYSRSPADLTAAIRGAVACHADWNETAVLVAGALRRHLPGTEILTSRERDGSPDGYVCDVLHTEADGSFSVCTLVWRPGQQTAIHDHVTWCVLAVLQGSENEELYALRENDTCLEQIGSNDNHVGEISAFAPPGDIHRVRNSSDQVAISLHIYGADITRLGSSVRRTYDLPVLSPAR